MRFPSGLSRRNAASFLLLTLTLVCAVSAQSVVWTPSAGGLGFGNDLARIGDLDADGADDFCVGRRDGVVEIVSGRTGALIRSHTCPIGSGVTRVAGLGDVDADGTGDYAIGARGAENPNLGSQRAAAGWVAVFSGAAGGLLWQNYGARWYTSEGSAVATVGDVDGNGRPDLVVGAFGWPGFGTGRNSGRAAVRDGLTGALLWEVTGAPSPEQKLGASVAGCGGDVDGDGRPDVVVRSVDPSQVQIFSGSTGALLRTWTGPDYQDADGLGDVDGDGVADVVIGMHDLPNENGTARVYSGATGAELRAVTFSKGAWTGFGGVVTRLGDLSGDGVAEYAVGCLGTYTYTTVGWARVYDGATGALRTCMDGSFAAGKLFGASLAAGDADGDGRPDLLVGAPAYKPGINEPGRVEVYGVLTAGNLVVLPHACGPIGIAAGGQPRIGDRVSLRMCGVVGTPVIGIGFTPFAFPFCGCTIGHEWGIQLRSDSVWINVPNKPELIGAQFAAQGIDAFGVGGCPSPTITVTDTIVFTIG